jgi:hypothetical protein
MTPLLWFFEALAVAAFVTEAFAFVDVLRRPTGAFPAVGKLTKPLWTIITGVAAVVGLGAVVIGGVATLVGFLPIIAFVAAAVYLTDVRPKVKDFRRGTSSGPYGPW